MRICKGTTTITLLLLGSAACATEDPVSAGQESPPIRLEYDRVLRAVVDPQHGGELSGLSVFIEGRWQELIYRAKDYSDRAGWRGKAPLLWPATGVSISASGGRGSYTEGGRLYEMPMHGFARTQPWAVLQKVSSPDSSVVILGLSDSDRSRSLYPFGFGLKVEYRVDSCGLHIGYRVSAAADNESAMPFSIGNHITFRLPLVAASAPEETEFQTNLPEEYIVDASRVFTGRTRASQYTGRQRVGELPHRRAVSLGGAVIRPRVTVVDPSGFSVALSHEVPEGVPGKTVKFNLWADLEEGFFSPEPWIGAQNSLNSGYGLVRLLPGRDWGWRIRIQPSTLQCESQAGSS